MMETKLSSSLESYHSTTSSSTNSNTTSNGSGLALPEPELVADEGTSPIDLECLIQTERIAKLLQHAIYKTKLSLCLPSLMQEHQTLAALLHQQDLAEVSFIFEQYVNTLFSTSLTNMNALEAIEEGDNTLKYRLNPELAHLLYILNKYKQLGPKVEAMIMDIKHTKDAGNLPPKQNDIVSVKAPPVGFDYLMQLEIFYGQLITRTQTKAADELKAMLETKRLENSNRNLIEQIKECEDAIKDENEAFEIYLRDKRELIKQLEMKVNAIQQTSAMTLAAKVRDADRRMVMHTRSHQARHRMLKEEENDSRETYSRTLNKDIADETIHRHSRRKVESQLLLWVQKYDADMSEKQAELNEMSDKYEDEVAKVADLELQKKKQDVEYEKLMAEREEEYHAELTQKMNICMVDHAARVVQMAWADVGFNHIEQKELRKLLKNRQDAAEAAENAAELQAHKEAAAEKKAAAIAKKQALRNESGEGSRKEGRRSRKGRKSKTVKKS